MHRLKIKVLRFFYHFFKNQYNNAVHKKRKQISDFEITRHAFLRYFERIEGYDIKSIIEKLTDGLKEKVEKDGDGKYVINGVRVTVVEGSIVTIDTNKRDQAFKDRIVANPIRGLSKLKDKKV